MQTWNSTVRRTARRCGDGLRTAGRTTALFLGALLFGLGCSPRAAVEPKAPSLASSPSGLLAEGRKRLAAGEELMAEQYFLAAWNRGAERRTVLANVLPLCFRSNRLGSALGYVERGLAEEPRDARLSELAALLESNLGRERSALARLRELERAEVLAPELYFELGTLELRAGESGHAERAFRLYLARVPHGRHRIEAVSALENFSTKEGRPE